MATSYTKDTLKIIGKERVVIHGTVYPNGTGTPTTEGHGWTVARTDTGDFTITLDKPVPAVVDAQISIQAADSTPTIVQWADFVETSGTYAFTILQESGGTLAPADLTADANARVCFSLTARDYSGSY